MSKHMFKGTEPRSCDNILADYLNVRRSSLIALQNKLHEIHKNLEFFMDAVAAGQVQDLRPHVAKVRTLSAHIKSMAEGLGANDKIKLMQDKKILIDGADVFSAAFIRSRAHAQTVQQICGFLDTLENRHSLMSAEATARSEERRNRLIRDFKANILPSFDAENLGSIFADIRQMQESLKELRKEYHEKAKQEALFNRFLQTAQSLTKSVGNRLGVWGKSLQQITQKVATIKLPKINIPQSHTLIGERIIRFAPAAVASTLIAATMMFVPAGGQNHAAQAKADFKAAAQQVTSHVASNAKTATNTIDWRIAENSSIAPMDSIPAGISPQAEPLQTRFKAPPKVTGTISDVEKILENLNGQSPAAHHGENLCSMKSELSKAGEILTGLERNSRAVKKATAIYQADVKWIQSTEVYRQQHPQNFRPEALKCA